MGLTCKTFLAYSKNTIFTDVRRWCIRWDSGASILDCDVITCTFARHQRRAVHCQRDSSNFRRSDSQALPIRLPWFFACHESTTLSSNPAPFMALSTFLPSQTRSANDPSWNLTKYLLISLSWLPSLPKSDHNNGVGKSIFPRAVVAVQSP